ncbi:MAG: DNA-processing protein DprA [Planctomycetota bacterium]
MENQKRKEYAELCAIILLSRKPGVGAARFVELLQKWGCPEKALEKTEEDSLEKEKRPKTTFVPPSWETLQCRQISFCYYGGNHYPKMFYALSEPPPYLFYRGHPFWESEPILSIVGSRTPSSKGIQLAQKITQWAVQEGYGIASGGAFGIDAVAHQTCLDLGGKTMVLLACGVEKVYPKKHQNLFQTILNTQGCLISEFLPETAPRISFFPTRNRLLAGIAESVIWIEGRANSGALYTAKKTLQLRKKLWVGYGDIPELQEGPKMFLSQGASMISDLLKT